MNILYINANQRNKLSHTAGYATHMAKTIKGFEAAGHHVALIAHPPGDRLDMLAGDDVDSPDLVRVQRTGHRGVVHAGRPGDILQGGDPSSLAQVVSLRRLAPLLHRFALELLDHKVSLSVPTPSLPTPTQYGKRLT